MKIYLYRAAGFLADLSALGLAAAAGYFYGQDRRVAVVLCLFLLLLPAMVKSALPLLAGHVFDDYASCCGCGTIRKVDRYAVWGPGDPGRENAETYCWRCFAQGFDPAEDEDGYAYAHVAPVVSRAQFEGARDREYPKRQTVAGGAT